MGTPGTDKSETQTGKLMRNFSGATTMQALFGNASFQVRCRRLIADGAVTYTGIDDNNVALPDRGVGYVYDVDFIAIVSGNGTAVL